MTATDAAPDPTAAAEARWQHLLDRIHDLEAQVAATTSTVAAALDTRLARLDALRHHLAQPAWPLPTPGPEQQAPGHAAEQPAGLRTWAGATPRSGTAQAFKPGVRVPPEHPESGRRSYSPQA